MGIFGNLLGWVPLIGKPIGGLVDDLGNGLISGAGGIIDDVFDWGSEKVINPIYDGALKPIFNKAGDVVDSGTGAVDAVFKYLPWILGLGLVSMIVIPLVMK